MENTTAAACACTQDKRSTANTSLDPDNWAELRAQAHRMLDDMLDYTAGIRQFPVWQPVPDEIRARFHQELPAQPTPLADVHQEFMTSILPYTARNGHPGFMGWAQGGGTPVGMLMELLASALNANLGGRDQSPLDVERQITEWMRTLFGFPAAASGLLLTGTSMANFVAVKVARDFALGREARRRGVHQGAQRLAAYASSAAHGCVAQAFDLSGLGSHCLRLVPVDGRHHIKLDKLAELVAADRQAGFTPFLVVGTAGTVDTGAVDDLDAIATFCAQQQLWFHIDGAFAALIKLVPELAPLVNGIERADSLAFDFHKWAQVPYDAGFLLMRDGDRHLAAFASSDAYLGREQRGLSAGSPWPCDFGPDLSRGFRALKVWATFKVYGTDAMAAVIAHTCRLARYLEARIAATPDLELMAPVQLNIVCFRYCHGSLHEAQREESLNRINRQIVFAVQEAGAVVPSTTMIEGRLVIRAAIMNHRTTQTDIDTLLATVLTAGRALASQPLGVIAPAIDEHQSASPPLAKLAGNAAQGSSWQPWLQRNAKLEKIDLLLNSGEMLDKAKEVALRYERAVLLSQLGQKLEAQTEHLRVFDLAPTHERNLNSLGLLLAFTGKRKAALLCLEKAVENHPKSTGSRVNYGCVLLEDRNWAAAREQFAAALQLDPDFPQAHAGMWYALSSLGELESAESHRLRGFATKHVFTNVYRGNTPPIPVLLLVSTTGGIAPLEKRLDDTVFETHVVVADVYDLTKPLPPHRLVINSIGDADVSYPALVAAQELIAHTAAPVLNLPWAVMATRRCENAARLRSLSGVIAPITRMFPYAGLAAPQGHQLLREQGFAFPLLLRAPGFHGGEHFIKVDRGEELSQAVAQLPGASLSGASLLAIEYLDAQGSDGKYRKYRVMMIDGQLYPLHVAVSSRWKIHYFSSDMKQEPGHRDEEAAFLADMHAVLGAWAMESLARIQAAMGLEYGGIDFALSPSGDILLFEANATMIVPFPDEGEIWDYRRPAVKRIHTAIHEMFLSHAQNASLAHPQAIRA